MEYKPQDILGWMQRHIHPNATLEHLAAITGWLPETRLWVSNSGKMNPDNPEMEPHSLDVSVSPMARRMASGMVPDYDTSRELIGRFAHNGYVSPTGVPEIHNNFTTIRNDPANKFRGASGAVLLRQMRAAHELGIPKIGWYAAWEPPGTEDRMKEQGAQYHKGYDFKGGLHWPLLGADGRLSHSHLMDIPPDIFREADTASGGKLRAGGLISALFASPRGREWYIAHPTGHSAWVDTHPGSYSRLSVERHVGEQAARFGFEGPIPDAQMTGKLPNQHIPPEQSKSKGDKFYPDDVSEAFPRESTPFAMTSRIKLHFEKLRRKVYHPALEHLIATGSIHPDFYDEMFNK